MTDTKKHERLKKLIDLWLLILYALFIFLDFFTVIDTSIIKYSFVWACIGYILITKEDSLHINDWKFVLYGFFLIAIADFFLLFTNYFLLGIYLFCLVQLCYLRRLNTKKQYNLILVVIAILSLFIWTQFLVSHLTFAAILYALLLLGHFLSTFWTKKPVKKHLLQIGMIGFVICDISVALYNRLPSYDPLYLLSSLTMWTFYAPALYCISHSVLEKKKKPTI